MNVHAPRPDRSPEAVAARKKAVDQARAANMRQGYTGDPVNHDKETGSDTFIRYDPDNNLLGDHAITRGRNASEKISRIIAFTGQSLKGPAESSAILKLADSAQDAGGRERKEMVPAAGRAQALAFKVGKGRVVVHGEAAMLSAQISGQENFKMGMNVEGYDNKQYALNLMHWLSGVLKEKF